jgi:hypothetical protein
MADGVRITGRSKTIFSRNYDEQLQLVYEDGETIVGHRRYRITASNGQIWEGISDADGLTRRVFTQTEVALSIEIFYDEDEW